MKRTKHFEQRIRQRSISELEIDYAHAWRKLCKWTHSTVEEKSGETNAGD